MYACSVVSVCLLQSDSSRGEFTLICKQTHTCSECACSGIYRYTHPFYTSRNTIRLDYCICTTISSPLIFPPYVFRPLTSSSLIQLIADVMFCSLSLMGRLFPSPITGGGLALVCRPIVPFSLIPPFLVRLESYALYLCITTEYYSTVQNSGSSINTPTTSCEYYGL